MIPANRPMASLVEVAVEDRELWSVVKDIALPS